MISIIHLPNKEKLDINQKSSYPYNPSYSNSFSLSTSTNAFDPNISGSPPNLFMNSLKNRMDIYYEKKSSKSTTQN
jgi:hypothetical protein